jgi:predicted GNAT family acetyltransferase
MMAAVFSGWYTLPVSIELGIPAGGDIRWAVGVEFELLPAVDPAFAPQNLGPLRKLILQHVALPRGYRQSPVRLVARQDGIRCGFLFTRSRGSTLHIDSIGVLPEYQRQGIGTILVAEAEKQARAKDFDYLTAAVTAGNPAALGLLEKAGFRPYRKEHWVLAGDGINSEPTAAWQIREFSPTQTLPAFERWQRAAVEPGDPWAAGLILGEYARLNWRATARHWACLAEGEEVGYLRISGLRGDFAAFLALSPEWWDSPAQASWLDLALQTYPGRPGGITVGLAADAHFAPSRAAWEAAGFEAQARERFLCLKQL